MPRPLVKYEDYTREEVHDIFNPHSRFTPNTGTWGLHGIVRIPNRKGDFVFFVTVGKRQGDHVFREYITESGILTWQSQPKQKLTSSVIQELINHNHYINNIYLFFRTSGDMPYTYMGRLAYVAHDVNREKPVYFKWQLLDWKIPDSKVKSMALELIPDFDEIARGEKPRLVLTDLSLVMENLPSYGCFLSSAINFAENEKWAKEIGLGGELLVLANEKEHLTRAGRSDLAERVVHTAVIEGDGAGYDIQSFNLDGSIKYIEVKTTVGGGVTPFMLTLNEITFSRMHSRQYALYRLYGYVKRWPSAKYFVIEGDITEKLYLDPTEFRARIK